MGQFCQNIQQISWMQIKNGQKITKFQSNFFKKIIIFVVNVKLHLNMIAKIAITSF